MASGPPEPKRRRLVEVMRRGSQGIGPAQAAAPPPAASPTAGGAAAHAAASACAAPPVHAALQPPRSPPRQQQQQHQQEPEQWQSQSQGQGQQQQQQQPAAGAGGGAPAEARAAEEDDDDDGGLLDAAPSDVEAAVALLKAELYGAAAEAAAAAAAPRRGRGRGRSAGPPPAPARAPQAAAPPAPMPPLVLKAQIYTVVPDRTAADRDLDDLARRGRARVFRLATGADEFAVLLMGDYLDMISGMIWKQEQQQQQQQQQGQGAEAPAPLGEGGRRVATASETAAAAAAALRRFRERVAPRWRGASIDTGELLQLLSAADDRAGSGGGPGSGGNGGGGRPAAGARSAAAAAAARAAGGDADISHLLAAELLSRDPAAAGRLVFTVPGAARLVRWLADGRQELAAALSKKRFGEALEKELLKLKLRRSGLGVRFHLRDLLGRGAAARAASPAGPLVRLLRQ